MLSAYVGRNGGDQVLKGKIHRGDGEEIEASILFTDIAGFTELSNAMAGPDVVAMLNDAFDLMVPAVESHGGEILKFLGDGFFAIFPHEGDDGMAKTADAARAAVAESEAAVAGAPVGERVSFRSAIHAGRFHYGNIGGANRLDFTAIGRPVNYTARLLAAASTLKLTPRRLGAGGAASRRAGTACRGGAVQGIFRRPSRCSPTRTTCARRCYFGMCASTTVLHCGVSLSNCLARHSTTRPPPGSTPGQNFSKSAWQAARSAAVCAMALPDNALRGKQQPQEAAWRIPLNTRIRYADTSVTSPRQVEFYERELRRGDR